MRFPTLFHAAADGAWESLIDLGLLPVSHLLEAAQVDANFRAAIERDRRAQSVPLAIRGRTVVIRDQKPLSVSKLSKALTDVTVDEWFVLLNERVFFWPSAERLQRFLEAASYLDQTHLVVEVSSLRLFQRHRDQIFVSTMNTGATRPFAMPRGRATFQRIADLDRRRIRKVAEVTVVGGVTDLLEVVTRAYRFRAGAKIEPVWPLTTS